METTPALRPTLARWCAGPAAIGMGIVGAFHVLWAFSPWPLKTWWDWNRTVVGTDDPAARTGAVWVVECCAIAGLLLAGAYIVGTRAGLFRRLGPWWAFRIAAWCVVLVLLTRASLGPAMASPDDLPFNRWNLILYSPLCLALAALSAVAIGCAGRYPHGRDAAAGWFPRQR